MKRCCKECLKSILKDILVSYKSIPLNVISPKCRGRRKRELLDLYNFLCDKYHFPRETIWKEVNRERRIQLLKKKKVDD